MPCCDDPTPTALAEGNYCSSALGMLKMHLVGLFLSSRTRCRGTALCELTWSASGPLGGATSPSAGQQQGALQDPAASPPLRLGCRVGCPALPPSRLSWTPPPPSTASRPIASGRSWAGALSAAPPPPLAVFLSYLHARILGVMFSTKTISY